MKSCVRLLIRRICLRKGLSSVILIVYIVGFLGAYHYLHHTGEPQLEDAVPRNVKVVSFLL